MRSRYARKSDIPAIMTIIYQAQNRLCEMGVNQWQDGYPDETFISADIDKKQGYVFIEKEKIVAYAAIVFEPDPYYQHIDGQWMDNQPYVVVHRLAVHDCYTHRGAAKFILKTAEKKALRKKIGAFRIDTHQGNHYMRNLIRQYGFTLCGIVQVRDGKRMAYQLNLQNHRNESFQA